MCTDSSIDTSNSEGHNSKATVAFRINDDTFCLLIAALEVVGGVIGIVSFFYQYGTFPLNYNLALVISGFGWSVYAGVKLWQGQRKGLKYSLILQAIQIPVFLSHTFGYLFYSGAGILMGIIRVGTWDQFKIDFMLGSGWQLTFGLPLPMVGVGVNLVAVATFSYLAKTEIKLRRLEAARELETRARQLLSE